MNRFQAKYIEQREVARNTRSFRFDLEGQRFEFLPGQFITLSLSGQSGLDEQNQTRTFSIASTPGGRSLLVATRMTGSPFKKKLASLEEETTVTIEGPGGHFVFDTPGPSPVVFLAGGIGITPFRSMLQYEFKQGSSHQIQLLYSNHTPADAPFLDELQRWEKEQERFQLVATMTQATKDGSRWDGETGRIDAGFLQKQVRQMSEAVFFTAGPPRFVRAMKGLLSELNVPDERAHSEEFSGY